MNSRQKGKRGELDLVDFLRAWGFMARRGQQFSGGGDSPDVVANLAGVHIECKRVEAGNLYGWLKQAERDAPEGKIPMVFHRRNEEQWVVIMHAADFMLNYARKSEPTTELVVTRTVKD